MSHYVVTTVIPGAGNKGNDAALSETKTDLTAARSLAIKNSKIKGVDRVVITCVTERHEATYRKGEKT